MGIIRYVDRTIRDVFLFNTKIYIGNLAGSVRFFYVIIVASIGSLVFLTLLSFSLRTHIPLVRLPRYLIFHIRKLLPQTSVSMHMYGTVVDAHLNSPITQADVYIIEADKNVVAEKTFTNKAGEFFANSLPERHYTLQVMKKGYESHVSEYPIPDGIPAIGTISLRKSETLEQSIRENVSWAIENVVGFFFELLLIASFIFELLFGYSLGWQKVAPFLLISLANLLLWLLYIRHVFARKS